MPSSSKTHRDEFERTDLVDQDRDAVPVFAPVAPVMTNADAARVATAQRAIPKAEAPAATPQRQFTDDVPPPIDAPREFTVGGDDNTTTPPAPLAPPTDEDGGVARLGDATLARRGPPAPLATTVGGDRAWLATQNDSAHVASDRANAWLDVGQRDSHELGAVAGWSIVRVDR